MKKLLVLVFIVLMAGDCYGQLLRSVARIDGPVTHEQILVGGNLDGGLVLVSGFITDYYNNEPIHQAEIWSGAGFSTLSQYGMYTLPHIGGTWLFQTAKDGYQNTSGLVHVDGESVLANFWMEGDVDKCYCDSNDDCEVDLHDLFTMKQEFLGDEPFSTDCNRDGRVNLYDLRRMKEDFFKYDCCY